MECSESAEIKSGARISARPKGKEIHPEPKRQPREEKEKGEEKQKH